MAASLSFSSARYGPQRCEPRLQTHREVTLSRVGANPETCSARVLDFSLSGFRVRHRLTVRPGDEVKINGTILTRVVWVNQTQNESESGLVLLIGNAERRPPQAAGPPGPPETTAILFGTHESTKWTTASEPVLPKHPQTDDKSC